MSELTDDQFLLELLKASESEDFLLVLVHELRTPLNVLHHALTFISEDLAKYGNTKQQSIHETVEIGLKTVANASAMLNAVMEYNSIKYGKLRDPRTQPPEPNE
ncbi:MAG: hypothetical protein H7Y02_12975 [Candidatus Obscuribacterales bacterium]|nr:hypothetical protein [Steroidobacteraceae bacterium]